MSAIFRHELSNYLHGMSAYVFGAFLLVFIGISVLYYNLQHSVANFEYVLGSASIVFIIIIPILTMNVISEEKRQKTDQLLYSLPLSMSSIVIGKFLALLVIFAVPLLIVALYPLLFAQYGDVYLPTSYGSLLAFFLLGAALIAVGMFISSLTESQGIAAALCVITVLLNYYAVSLAEYFSATAFGSLVTLLVGAALVGLIVKNMTGSKGAGYITALLIGGGLLAFYAYDEEFFVGLVPSLMSEISLFECLYTFVDGVFDVTAIVYFLSVTVFFLFLAVMSLDKRRYS